MRAAGEVTFAEVFRDGEYMRGEVDFATENDVHYAVDKLDDSEFRNPFATAMIKVTESSSSRGGGARSGGKRDYSRSRSGSQSRGLKVRKESHSRSPRGCAARARKSSSPMAKDNTDKWDDEAGVLFRTRAQPTLNLLLLLFLYASV